jgi:hypothetical protein
MNANERVKKRVDELVAEVSLGFARGDSTRQRGTPAY